MPRVWSNQRFRDRLPGCDTAAGGSPPWAVQHAQAEAPPMSTALPTIASAPEFPPILLGNVTPQIQQRVERFYGSLAEIFEAWVQRCGNPHTQRAYRADVMAFVAFLGIAWTQEPWELFRVTVPRCRPGGMP